MRVYYYGEPSKALLRWAFKSKKRAPHLRFVLAILLAPILFTTVFVTWPLIKLGNIAHSIAGWVGFDSRDW